MHCYAWEQVRANRYNCCSSLGQRTCCACLYSAIFGRNQYNWNSWREAENQKSSVGYQLVQADHCGCIWTRIFLLLTVDTIIGKDFLQWRLVFASELSKWKKISSTLNVGVCCLLTKQWLGKQCNGTNVSRQTFCSYVVPHLVRA